MQKNVLTFYRIINFLLSFWGKNIMIKLTRLNGSSFVLNCELIETVEATPDTVITTTDSKKYVVVEKVDEIIEEVIKYKGRIMLHGRIWNSFRKD
jgi:flagellar protein FlbD